jgi:hypothetical protein
VIQTSIALDKGAVGESTRTLLGPRQLASAVVTLALFAVALQSGCAKYPTKTSGLLDYSPSKGLTLKSPAPDRSIVVIFRPDPGAYNATASLMDGVDYVGAMMTFSHYVYDTEPGPHRFSAYLTAIRHRPVDINLEAGKVHFIAFRAHPKFGGFHFEFEGVSPSNEMWNQLPQIFEVSDQVTPNQSGIDWFQDHQEELIMKMPHPQSKETLLGDPILTIGRIGLDRNEIDWLSDASAD